MQKIPCSEGQADDRQAHGRREEEVEEEHGRGQHQRGRVHHDGHHGQAWRKAQKVGGQEAKMGRERI